jgi:hypothetical protein
MELQKQIKIWKYLAWTAPFSALATLTVLYYFGWDEPMENVFSIGLVFFLSAAVFWWWWALENMLMLYKSLQISESKFLEIKSLFERIKKDLD